MNYEGSEVEREIIRMGMNLNGNWWRREGIRKGVD